MNPWRFITWSKRWRQRKRDPLHHHITTNTTSNITSATTKNQTFAEDAEDASFKTLLPMSRRNLRRIYLQRLKWIHRIKHDALHRTNYTSQENPSTLYLRGQHGFWRSGGVSCGKRKIPFKQSHRQKNSSRELGRWRRKRSLSVIHWIRIIWNKNAYFSVDLKFRTHELSDL